MSQVDTRDTKDTKNQQDQQKPKGIYYKQIRCYRLEIIIRFIKLNKYLNVT